MKLYQFLRLFRKTEYLVLASDSGEILGFGFHPLNIKGLESWEVVGLQTLPSGYCERLDPEGSLGSSGLFIVLKHPESKE